MSKSKGGKLVYVKVLRGDVYERQDVAGWADPYVIIKLGAENRKTSTKKDIKLPVWNEEFKIDKPRNAETNKICFELWDWNRVGSDDFIGRNTISVLPYKNKKQTITIPMLNLEKDKNEQGNIVVEIELEDSRKAKAIINILQGDIYEQHDTVGWADPYIVLKIGKDERKTSIKKNIKLPVWNEEFTFVDVDLRETNFVTFDLWDWERFGNNDFVASATVSLLPYTNKKQRVRIVFHNDEKASKEQAGVDADIELQVEVHEDDVEGEKDEAASAVAERAVAPVKEGAGDEAEKQRLAAEAEEAEKQRLAAEAEEAEKQRLAAEAEEAEKQRLAAEAEEAEKQRLAAEAEEAEKQRLAAEAEEAEKQRLAAEAEEAEKQRLMAEAAEAQKQRLAAEAAAAAEEAERKRLTEEAAKQKQSAEVEAEKKKKAAAEAEAERKRLAAEAEKKRKAEEDAEKKRKADEEAEKKKRKAVEEETGKVKEKGLSDSDQNKGHTCLWLCVVVVVIGLLYAFFKN